MVMNWQSSDSASMHACCSLLARFYGILKEKAAQEDELARLRGDAPAKSSGVAPTKPEIAVRKAPQPAIAVPKTQPDVAVRKAQ